MSPSAATLRGLIRLARAPLLVLGLARAGAAGLGLVSSALVAALLGPASLGVWALALNLQGWVQHLGEMGLRSTATAEAARTGDARPLVAPYVAARLGCTALVALMAWGAASWITPEIATVLGLALLALVPMALQLDWVALVEGRSVAAAVPLVLRPAAFLAGIAVWAGPIEPWGVALVFTLSWLAAAASTWGGRPWHGRPDGAVIARLLRAGPPLALNGLLNHALLGLDLWVVAHLAGTAATGCYHLAAQLAVAGIVTANAAGQLALARPAAEPDATARALTALAWLGAGQGALLTAVGPWLVPRVFGPEFAWSATLLGPFAVWIALQHLSAPLQSERTVAGGRRPVAIAALAAVAVTCGVLATAAALDMVALAAWCRPAAELVRVTLLLAAAPAGLRRALRPAALPLLLVLALALLAPIATGP